MNHMFTDGDVSHVLKHVTVPIVDHVTCSKQHQNVTVEDSVYFSTCSLTYKKFQNITLEFPETELKIEVLFDIVEDKDNPDNSSCLLVNVLRNISIPISDDPLCVNISSGSCQFIHVTRNVTESLEITNDMLCAGWPKGARDSCQVGTVLYKILLKSNLNTSTSTLL